MMWLLPDSQMVRRLTLTIPLASLPVSEADAQQPAASEVLDSVAAIATGPMRARGVPGFALGVSINGGEVFDGFGVTSIEDTAPSDGSESTTGLHVGSTRVR
ncbi:MAG TPA: hypothetical protein VKA44_00750 [Gemmatimonadota bacterium]|nr:hypothetical protein [Gemmatimonadota bacterium]